MVRWGDIVNLAGVALRGLLVALGAVWLICGLWIANPPVMLLGLALAACGLYLMLRLSQVVRRVLLLAVAQLAGMQGESGVACCLLRWLEQMYPDAAAWVKQWRSKRAS